MGFVGYILLIDYVPGVIEPVRFIIGFCIISVAFPLGRGVTLSMFSKIIGKHKAGVYMGYMLGVGAISRIIGPFWSVQSLTVSPALTFGISAFLFLINIVAQWMYNESLNPHWSYFIEMFEEKQKNKSGDETARKYVAVGTPGSLNPYSPGFMPFNVMKTKSGPKKAKKGE
jgi:hypothetical protein